MKRSNTLTLDSLHKDKSNQRRQSSLAVRRSQNRRNLPIKNVFLIQDEFELQLLVEKRQSAFGISSLILQLEM